MNLEENQSEKRKKNSVQKCKLLYIILRKKMLF